MSIRAFVASCSALLLVWLGVAFVYTPVVQNGMDQLTDETQGASPEEEIENLTVSVSR